MASLNVVVSSSKYPPTLNVEWCVPYVLPDDPTTMVDAKSVPV